jgi:enediyne biosynthesis protein E5
MRDPRLYQIATLASLLAYGMGWLEFDVTVPRAALLLGTALATQAAGDRLEGRPANWKSALISGLSLCLLLRTNHAALALLAAVIAIGSKFVIRFRGKHLFNPTNGGIVAMLLLSEQVWVSPGQWGSVAMFALLMACVGGLVVNRAARSDVTFAFIAAYCALLFGRSLYLGEPLTIPLHRLQSGALLLFTFFMISDPKTTPDSRAGRVIFAALVAFGAWYVQFRLFRTNGLLWSLAFWSLAVPAIDWLLPGDRYRWQQLPAGSEDPAATTFVRPPAGSEDRAASAFVRPPAGSEDRAASAFVRPPAGSEDRAASAFVRPPAGSEDRATSGFVRLPAGSQDPAATAFVYWPAGTREPAPAGNFCRPHARRYQYTGRSRHSLGGGGTPGATATAPAISKGSFQ